MKLFLTVYLEGARIPLVGWTLPPNPHGTRARVLVCRSEKTHFGSSSADGSLVLEFRGLIREAGTPHGRERDRAGAECRARPDARQARTAVPPGGSPQRWLELWHPSHRHCVFLFTCVCNAHGSTKVAHVPTSDVLTRRHGPRFSLHPIIIKVWMAEDMVT